MLQTCSLLSRRAVTGQREGAAGSADSSGKLWAGADKDIRGAAFMLTAAGWGIRATYDWKYSEFAEQEVRETAEALQQRRAETDRTGQGGDCGGQK